MHLNRKPSYSNAWPSYFLQIQIVYILLQFLAPTQSEELFSKMCNPFFPHVQPLSTDDILKHKLHKCFRLHAYPLGKRNHVHVSFRQWPLIEEEHCKKFIALNISLQAFNKKSWPFGRWLSTSLHHPELCSYEEASIKIEAIEGHVQDCDGLMKLEDVKSNPVGTIQQNPTNLRRVNMYKYGFQKRTQNKGGICTTWTYSPKNLSVRVASELGGVRNAKKYFSHFHVTFLAELLVVPENKTKIKPFLYSIQSNTFDFDGNYTTDHHESHCHRAHPSNKNFRPLVFSQNLLLPKAYSDLLLNLTGSRSSSIPSKSNSSSIILNGNSIQISHLYKTTVPSVPHNINYSSTSHNNVLYPKQLRTLGPLQNKQKQLYSKSNPSKLKKTKKNQVSVIMLNHDNDINTVLNEIVSAILSVSNNDTKVLNPNLNLMQHLKSLDDKEGNIKSAVSTAKPNKMIGLGRNVIGSNPSNSEKQLKKNENTAVAGNKPSKKIAGRSIIQNNMNSLDEGDVNDISSGRTTRSLKSEGNNKSKNWWGKKKTKNMVRSMEPAPTETNTTDIDKPLNLEWTTATASAILDIMTTPTTVTEEESVTMSSTTTTTTTTVPPTTTSTTITTTRVPTTTSASTPTTTTPTTSTTTATAAPTTTPLTTTKTTTPLTTTKTTTPPPETTTTGSTLTPKKIPQIPATASQLQNAISLIANNNITTKVTPKPVSHIMLTTVRVKSKGRSSKRGKKKDKVDKPIRTVQ